MTIDIFTLGLTFILMHELDAMRCHEWRIFPATSFMKDKMGMITYIFLHFSTFLFSVIANYFKQSIISLWILYFFYCSFLSSPFISSS